MSDDPHNWRERAFTRKELMVVIAVAVLLALLIAPSLNRARIRGLGLCCNCNMKEIGIAYRLFAGDNGGLVPAQQMVVSNGWKDFLTNGNAGPKCWMNYAALAVDLGQSPKWVLCPSDDRPVAASFTNGFDNTNISYFVGGGASALYPRSIAGGDRNLGPGATPDPDYGYSPMDGRGNDVAIATNSAVSWSLKIHSARSAAGAGNILLGDGSVQQVSTTNLNINWLRNAQDSGNWPTGHAPAIPSIRLVFP